jgi:hypothetical protein
MKYKVIDNFLDEEYFDKLVTLFTDNRAPSGNVIMLWTLCTSVTTEGAEDNIFYMASVHYNNNAPTTPLYKEFIPLLEKLEAKCLIRIKANLYPNTHKLHEHPMHIDYEFSHSGAVLSLNTCDGYTKLKDGTKIDSVANRVLLFDPSEEHCSTTTTNDYARFTININYINVKNNLNH